MTEERRAIQSNVDYAVKNQPRSLVRRQELLTDGETVHLPCDGGELILAYENGQQSVHWGCLLYTSPSPRDGLLSRMPSSA